MNGPDIKAEMMLSDVRDFALVVLVDHKGVADAHAQGITKKQGAEWLRVIADQWDHQAEQGQGAPAA